MSTSRTFLFLISVSIISIQSCFAHGYQPPPQYQQPVHNQQPPQQQQQYQQPPHHQQAAYGQQAGVPAGNQNLLHDSAKIHDRKHIGEHLHGAVNEQDLSKMTEEELQFHYFKMHDNDNNNKLDGTELIKSLIHWHGM
jgi:hypothetical protein